jgi:hypothetical protein
MSRDAMKTEMIRMCPAAVKMQTRKTTRKIRQHKPVMPITKTMRIVDAPNQTHANRLSPLPTT